MNPFKNLKKEYNEVEIPSELEELVNNAIKRAKHLPKKPSYMKRWSLASAAATAIFIGSINASPAFAQTMLTVPFLGNIVNVLTAQEFAVEDESYQAKLTTPEIEGLEDEGLQASLNEKYIEENKLLLEQFEQETAAMKEVGEGHFGVDSGYKVLTDTEQLLSIARYQVSTNASSHTTMKYDTIDKENNILITLPSLFKDDQYIAVISSYIQKEMQEKMANDEAVSFFESDELVDGFEKIDPHQSFYITSTHKLVIAFDQYEVAPGYMGIVTFEIPSALLEQLLVSDRYIH